MFEKPTKFGEEVPRAPREPRFAPRGSEELSTRQICMAAMRLTAAGGCGTVRSRWAWCSARAEGNDMRHRVRVTIEYDLDVSEGASGEELHEAMMKERRDWLEGNVTAEDVVQCEGDGGLHVQVITV